MENLCRICLRHPDLLLPLFADPLLPHKIEVISTVQVLPDDNLPSSICEECTKNINLFFNFRKVILSSDLDLKARYAALQFNLVEEEDETETKDFGLSSDTAIEEKSVPYEDKDITVSDSVDPDFGTRERTYKCRRCDFVTKNGEEFCLHRRRNVILRICPICGRSIRRDNINRHIQLHSALTAKCPVCGKLYKNQESLRSHLYVHRGIELMCNYCGKIYYSNSKYNRHLKIHTGSKQPYKCPVCEKMLSDKKCLKQHLRSHTGEKPYLCTTCGRGFSSSSALKTHDRQHTNERPYICEYCSMGFKQKVSLMNHIKSKH